MQANDWHIHLMPIAFPYPSSIHTPSMQANDWHTHLMPTGIFFHPQTFIYYSINALEFRLNNYSKKQEKRRETMFFEKKYVNN